MDYGATAEELEQHFHGCGSINRVTILCNKWDGQPKGFAYIEFGDKDSVQTAMALDESLFRGRQIKVRGLGNLTFVSDDTICFVFFLGHVKTHQQTRNQFKQQTSKRC